MNPYSYSNFILNHDFDTKTFVKNDNRTLNLTGEVDYRLVTGHHNTIYAGGSGDNIYLVDDGLGSRANYSAVYGEAGDDFVYVAANGCSIFGGKGNDRIVIEGTSNTYADGGDGNDRFQLQGSSQNIKLIGGAGDDTVSFVETSQDVTISGGSGKNTYNFDPYEEGYRKKGYSYHNTVTITDISENDVIRNRYYPSNGKTLDGTELDYSKNNEGDIVLKDDYGLFTITFQGVKDINKLAGVKYEAYGYTGTLGEIFRSDSSTVAPVTPDTVPSSGSGENSSVGNQYIVYSGGNKTVSYSENQQVNLATDFTGVEVDGDNFIVKSSSGQLTLQNVRGKYVKYGDANSNLVAYSYMGTNGSGSSGYSSVGNSYSSYNTIDARSKGAVYDVLIGGNNSNDVIYAGSGGSSLWGGSGGADTLVGGRGDDEFVYKYGDGNDVIQNAGSNDLVDLSIIKLSQITRAEVNISGVTIRFTDGGTLRVEGNASGMSYKVAEGTFRCNQYNGQWTTK